MDPPPPWTYAGRAAYFGDRVCFFCDQHNPAAAKFCNACGSPLHLRPCSQCDAVNDLAATNCYRCGAACPALFTASGAMRALSAAEPAPALVTPEDTGVAATVPEPVLRAGSRLFRPGRLLFVAAATILIAGSYVAYRTGSKPDAIPVAPEPTGAKQSTPAAVSAMSPDVESNPVEPETTAALQAPVPAASAEAEKRSSAHQSPAPIPATKRAKAYQGSTSIPATKRASARQSAAPVPATKSASARQAPAHSTKRGAAHRETEPELHASAAGRSPVARSPAAPRVSASIAQTHEAPQRDPWQTMHVSLAACGGGPIARMVCDQRVRRRFCEGHWDEPPCAGVAIDRGQ